MVVKKNISFEATWNYANIVRTEYDIRTPDPSCDRSTSNLIPDEDIEENVNKLAKLLGVKNISSEIEKIPEDAINYYSKVFIYLTFCPTSITMEYWKTLYKKIFAGSLSRFLILTSMVLRKTTDAEQKIAMNLLGNLASTFNLEYIHDSIDIEEGYNVHKNITSVKG